MRAVLDSKGLEVVVFPEGREGYALEFCQHLNMAITPNSYLLHWDEYRLLDTSLVATMYSELGNPCMWAILRRGDSMSKADGLFSRDPMSSSRDSEFFEEFRFRTAEEARDAYFKFYPFANNGQP